MSDSRTAKSYVNDLGKAAIVCPECFRKKVIEVEKFRGKKSALKIRCSCSHLFAVALEFRRHFRKPTELKGSYRMKPPLNSGGVTEITNLSLSGACFKIRGLHDLKDGQLGTLEFKLDNRKQTELFKHVIIRSVNKDEIGCEFLDQQAFERELGFYLRS